MDDTDGGDEQGGDHHPERRTLDAVLGPGTLPEQDVQGPAHPGAQGVGHALRVECLPAVAGRQQQQQADNGQGNPQEVDWPARGEYRHGQWAGELKRHGDTDRYGLQRYIEEEVHAAQRHAIDDDVTQGIAGHAYTPRAQYQQHYDAGEDQAQGGGALCADDGEHAFGQGCTGLYRCHGDEQQADREEGSGQAAGLGVHFCAAILKRLCG
ncbi:hypothetical protein D9M71_475980 [compost metagenome]